MYVTTYVCYDDCVARLYACLLDQKKSKKKKKINAGFFYNEQFHSVTYYQHMNFKWFKAIYGSDEISNIFNY